MDETVLSCKRLIREDSGFISAVFLPLAAVCVFAAIQRYDVFPNAPWWSPILSLWPLILPAALYLRKGRSSFTAVLAVIVPLEILCAFAAEFTLIGLSGFFVLLVVWANILPVWIHLDAGPAAAAWVAMGLIVAAIIPQQVYLVPKLIRLHSEATRIIVYAYEYKTKNGAFPRDLSGYSFRRPNLRSNFRFWGHGQDDKFTYPFKDSPHYDRTDKFSLRYYVSTKDTGYWFSSKRGWFVEDD